MPFSSMLNLKHNFNFSQATLIKPIHGKNSHRLLEFAVISMSNHIPQRIECHQISPYLANIILYENDMKIENG